VGTDTGGIGVPARRTPIEIAIDKASGKPDRSHKYVAKRNGLGLRRIAVWVPDEDVPELKRIAAAAVERHMRGEGCADD